MIPIYRLVRKIEIERGKIEKELDCNSDFCRGILQGLHMAQILARELFDECKLRAMNVNNNPYGLRTKPWSKKKFVGEH